MKLTQLTSQVVYSQYELVLCRLKNTKSTPIPQISSNSDITREAVMLPFIAAVSIVDAIGFIRHIAL